MIYVFLSYNASKKTISPSRLVIEEGNKTQRNHDNDSDDDNQGAANLQAVSGIKLTKQLEPVIKPKSGTESKKKKRKFRLWLGNEKKVEGKSTTDSDTNDKKSSECNKP